MKPAAEIQWFSAADGKIIDSAVHRQGADVAAGEKNGADDIGISGKTKFLKADGQYSAVFQTLKIGVIEMR